MGKDVDKNIYVCKQYYFSGRLEAADNNDYDPQKTDHDYEEDMRQFVAENEYLTGLGYRQIEVIIDPAAASFKAELRRYHFRVKNAKNDVLDGIRTVSTYFGNNKLFVSKECQSLIEELHSYSWDTKKAQFGIDAPIKTNDHGCIVGETLIHTTNGYVPIKDLVGTEGSIETINPITKEKCIKRYFNVCKTQENAKIIKLEFENGEIIQLTSNHPVLTDRGWVEAGNLTLEDNVISALD